MDVFFPRHCALCDNVLLPEEEGICQKCSTSVELIGEPKCRKCGKPLGSEEEYCQDCQGKNTSFLYGNCLFSYDSMMQESIARFKYGGRQEYADYFARMACRQYGDWLQQIAPDALVPVPIHAKRHRQRGYNQAELVAKQMEKYTGIPMRTDLVRRSKNTSPQKELSEQERWNNLRGAFVPGFQKNNDETNGFRELNHDLECVIIIDDIYTTGSTMEVCSQVLKTMGIERIYFLCLCVGQGS